LYDETTLLTDGILETSNNPYAGLFDLFLVYLGTFSEVQITQRNMIRRLMNHKKCGRDEPGWFEVLSQHLFGETEKTHETPKSQ
jgi:hypothetical protein